MSKTCKRNPARFLWYLIPVVIAIGVFLQSPTFDSAPYSTIHETLNLEALGICGDDTFNGLSFGFTETYNSASIFCGNMSVNIFWAIFYIAIATVLAWTLATCKPSR